MADVISTARALTPTERRREMGEPEEKPVARPRSRKCQIGVDLLAARYAQGRDLWTGDGLTGQNADDWLRLQYGRGEDEMQDEFDIQELIENEYDYLSRARALCGR